VWGGDGALPGACGSKDPSPAPWQPPPGIAAAEPASLCGGTTVPIRNQPAAIPPPPVARTIGVPIAPPARQQAALYKDKIVEDRPSIYDLVSRVGDRMSYAQNGTKSQAPPIQAAPQATRHMAVGMTDLILPWRYCPARSPIYTIPFIRAPGICVYNEEAFELRRTLESLDQSVLAYRHSAGVLVGQQPSGPHCMALH
jgi:hypothetical protein